MGKTILLNIDFQAEIAHQAGRVAATKMSTCRTKRPKAFIFVAAKQ